LIFKNLTLKKGTSEIGNWNLDIHHRLNTQQGNILNQLYGVAKNNVSDFNS